MHSQTRAFSLTHSSKYIHTSHTSTFFLTYTHRYYLLTLINTFIYIFSCTPYTHSHKHCHTFLHILLHMFIKHHIKIYSLFLSVSLFHTHIMEDIRVKVPTPCAIVFRYGESGNLSVERMWHLCQKKRSNVTFPLHILNIRNLSKWCWLSFQFIFFSPL
jgi:hypothetical protein